MTVPTTHPKQPLAISTPRKREAEDWALVLVAEGIASQVVRTGAGFGIAVDVADREAASEIVMAWREERAERARRRAGPAPRGATVFETAAAYIAALALLAFHVGLEISGRAAALREMGACQATLVLHGELWRLVTALTLHADLTHVAGNTLFGGFFLAAVASRLGIGVALLAFVATGAAGNLANALYYGSAHSSIGASTGVFGLVGVLAGLAAWQRHAEAVPGRGSWVAFAAALAIVAMLGSGGPGVDFSAHLFGLAAGAAAGLALARPFAGRPRLTRSGQTLAGASAATLVGLAWLWAGA
jgi:membrane associated rhomboid family serine protease